jgi:hypothetical protein
MFACLYMQAVTVQPTLPVVLTNYKNRKEVHILLSSDKVHHVKAQ